MSNETKKEFHSRNVTLGTGLSDQYAPVDTKILLTPFLNKGWTVNGNTKLDSKGKHLIELIHEDYKYHNGDSLNIQCLNSYDGSSALMLMGGYGRIACSNGLILGDIEGGRFVHRGLKIYDKIEHSYETIIAHLDEMKDRVAKLKGLEVPEHQQNLVTHAVLKAMYEKETKKYKTEIVNIRDNTVRRLNHTRRDADLGTDAFTRLNVLQENIIRFGVSRLMVKTTNKETNTSEINYVRKGGNENKLDSIKMNKIISDEYLKLVG